MFQEKLVCHPLVGESPISNPYAEVLTGRKNSNYRERYHDFKLIRDVTFVCPSKD